ncbi:MAG TPA: hypothetical protein PK926_01010 [Spirochaetota bacterium]|nr:hypothetical protein [Spirochaetota bacterium]HPI87928.1 hypothetical protein [Spirochaetota bacterium]HPR47340.1 hypothetical protein [Spirochaetota bacterium]
MADNLIDEIKNAESRAAEMIEEAVQAGEKRLSAIRDVCNREMARFEDESHAIRAETLNQALRIYEEKRQALGADQRPEIERLEQMARSRKDEAIRFILGRVLGETDGN